MNRLLSLTTACLAASLTLGCGAPGTHRPPGSVAPPVTVDEGNRHLTMVNVFTPTRGTQDEVAGAILAGLRESVRHLPGFVDASVHRSLDSPHVTVYAHWRDQASVDAAVAQIKGGAAPDMLRAFTLARSELHPYLVVGVVRGAR